jgi:hypothetical protein
MSAFYHPFRLIEATKGSRNEIHDRCLLLLMFRPGMATRLNRQGIPGRGDFDQNACAVVLVQKCAQPNFVALRDHNSTHFSVRIDQRRRSAMDDFAAVFSNWRHNGRISVSLVFRPA